MCDRFLESGTAQSLIAGLTPPFDCGLGHAGLGEVVRQYFRLGGGDGGELIAQSLRYAPMQGLAAALEQILVSCILNERVLKPIIASGGDPCTNRMSASASLSSAT